MFQKSNNRGKRVSNLDEQAMKEIGHVLIEDTDNETVYTTEIQYEER